MTLHNRFFALTAAMAALGVAHVAQATEQRRPYIVQLADKPAATYSGGVTGYAATQAKGGQKLDVSAAHVQSYITYLESVQQQKLSQVGAVGGKIHSYGIVFNGFSALLTPAQVKALKADPAVVAVNPDEPRELLTNYTPGFLGLDKAGGLWSKLGGVGAAGEDVVVGIIDGGIWPENAAFSDKVDGTGTPIASHLPGTVVFGPAPAGWNGACETGPGFTADMCNNKLVGARFFNQTYQSLVQAGNYTPHWSDYDSPRDQDGHGTHTASTAAGNYGVPAQVNGVSFGEVSGMAPRARVAAYKVCWTYDYPDDDGRRNSCFTGDSVAAIEAAVADGVDVINYSISGTQNNFNDPVEQAFLNAARAGVFVAASAGNSGPETDTSGAGGNTVAHISPWLTTVAASNHDRYSETSITLGNGARYIGASLAAAVPATAMVLSTAAVPAGGDPAAARLCYIGGLDPAVVSGKIVVCDRGVNARVDKSAAVKLAGGVGMVLANTSAAQSLNDDAHTLPTIHVSSGDGAAIKAYVGGVAEPTGALAQSAYVPGKVVAPVVAGFSSRGPNKGNANILKPDITAPGVGILAAYAPDSTQAERDAIADGSVIPGAYWDFLQGTSMSSPHVAGLAALLIQRFPALSPAAIKSALMTTATSTFPDGYPGMQNGALPWGQGAGHVNPNGAATPGLVYDLGEEDYFRFLCGIGALTSADIKCKTFGSLRVTDLNLASLTSADVLGRSSLTRKVRNVGDAAATYTASASLPGFDVTVVPSSLTLAPGESGSFRVDLARTTAANGVWNYGSLTWSDGTHTVKSPLTAKASLLAVFSNLSSELPVGGKLFTVGTGFAGTMSTVKSGLKPASRESLSVGTDPTGDGASACLEGGEGTLLVPVSVPAGTAVLRFGLYDEYTSGFAAGAYDDLDLFLFRSNGALAAQSLGASSFETVQLTAPAAGTYYACIAGYAPYGGSSDFTLFSWVLGSSEDASNMKVVAPVRTYLGGAGTVSLSWNVPPGDKYLGRVTYRDGTGATVGGTTVLVEADLPLPPAATLESPAKATQFLAR